MLFNESVENIVCPECGNVDFYTKDYSDEYGKWTEVLCDECDTEMVEGDSYSFEDRIHIAKKEYKSFKNGLVIKPGDEYSREFRKIWTYDKDGNKNVSYFTKRTLTKKSPKNLPLRSEYESEEDWMLEVMRRVLNKKLRVVKGYFLKKWRICETFSYCDSFWSPEGTSEKEAIRKYFKKMSCVIMRKVIF